MDELQKNKYYRVITKNQGPFDDIIMKGGIIIQHLENLPTTEKIMIIFPTEFKRKRINDDITNIKKKKKKNINIDTEDEEIKSDNNPIETEDEEIKSYNNLNNTKKKKKNININTEDTDLKSNNNTTPTTYGTDLSYYLNMNIMVRRSLSVDECSWFILLLIDGLIKGEVEFPSQLVEKNYNSTRGIIGGLCLVYLTRSFIQKTYGFSVSVYRRLNKETSTNLLCLHRKLNSSRYPPKVSESQHVLKDKGILRVLNEVIEFEDNK